MRYRTKILATLLAVELVFGGSIVGVVAEQEDCLLDGECTLSEEDFSDLQDNAINYEELISNEEYIQGSYEDNSGTFLAEVGDEDNGTDTIIANPEDCIIRITGGDFNQGNYTERYTNRSLDEPLLMKAGYQYWGKIKGAGYDNKTPGEGDIRWKPVEFVDNEVIGSTWIYPQETTFCFQTIKGIPEEKEVPLTFILNQELFLNGEWRDTGEKYTFNATFMTIPYSPIAEIKGLDRPIDLSKEKENEINIIVSGNNIQDPKQGDVKYNIQQIDFYALYPSGRKDFSFNANGSEIQYTKINEYTYKFYSTQGITEEKTLTCCVTFVELVFINGTWVKQSPYEYVYQDFTSMKIEPTPTLVPTATPTPVPTATETPIPQPTPTETPIPTPTHIPVIANINDSSVHGLENPLLLTPGTFYKFSVVGAGTNNNNPGEGDTRWVPEYWRMKSGSTKQKNWQIGTAKGISDARQIPILIFLQEQRFSNWQWVHTGQEGSIEVTVKTRAYPVSVPKAPITGLREMSIGKMKMQAQNKGTAVDGYQFKWSLDKSFNTGVKSASSTKHFIFRSGLIGGKTYYVKARGYKIVNGKKVYSTWSGTKSLKLNILPPKPTISSLSKNSTGFTVKWKAVSGVGGYQIRYSTASNFSPKKTASVTGASKTSWSKKNLVKGQTYYVGVRSYKVAADGTKYYSKWSVSKSIVIK